MNSIEEKSADPYEEVKKLQCLVQKLEFQNEQLKNQVKEEKTKGSGKERRSKSLGGYVLDNGLKQLNLSSVDLETNMEEFIDIDQLELSDDDSWLYMPPKGLTTEDVSLNPYKWLRKDLEDPENKELQLAKSALVNKLEELSILSSPNKEQEAEEAEIEEPFSENTAPADQTRIIDTRTFTRSKKKKSREEEEESENSKPLSFIEPAINIAKNGDIDDDSNYEYGYIRPELYQLSDFIDVHEKARMQEESLRQSTPVIPIRGTCSLPRSKKFPTNGIRAPRSSSSDTEDSYANNIENVKKHIRRPITSTPANTLKTFNSTHSSPLGSNSSLNNTAASSSLRRSLPNLAKSNASRRSSSTKSINSSSNSLKSNQHVNQQQNFRFPSQVRRESAPSPSFRKPLLQESCHSANSLSVQNPPGHHRGSAITPGRSQNRSGLPRPSKLPAPRPKLPVPFYQPKKSQVEESWSDGCF
ncbi:SLAIN motif-containing protein 2-like isoform X1 [Centruroides vittatus]|uniref:SLAIN motif-containing protein 2-like isoform X1 n=2 Tax=Centruroides vittatus TaxID=120091 RepID=UPI00350FFBE1